MGGKAKPRTGKAKGRPAEVAQLRTRIATLEAELSGLRAENRFQASLLCDIHEAVNGGESERSKLPSLIAHIGGSLAREVAAHRVTKDDLREAREHMACASADIAALQEDAARKPSTADETRVVVDGVEIIVRRVT